jgi:hypothetical protein
MPSAAETAVREFARQYDTPNTQRMVALCETGVIDWGQAGELSRNALAAGLSAVAR